MKKIIILGASGGCLDILSIIESINKTEKKPALDCIGFLDDNKDLRNKEFFGIPVLGPFSLAGVYVKDSYFITGIGSPYNYFKREKILENLNIPTSRYLNIIHPQAIVHHSSKLGKGCVIYQNCTLARETILGDHILCLPNSVINHGSKVGDYSIINSGACISGDVTMGHCNYIGSNATIKQNIHLGDYSQVGMGSVVLKDVESNQCVVGNPAKYLKSNI